MRYNFSWGVSLSQKVVARWKMRHSQTNVYGNIFSIMRTFCVCVGIQHCMYMLLLHKASVMQCPYVVWFCLCGEYFDIFVLYCVVNYSCCLLYTSGFFPSSFGFVNHLLLFFGFILVCFFVVPFFFCFVLLGQSLGLGHVVVSRVIVFLFSVY